MAASSRLERRVGLVASAVSTYYGSTYYGSTYYGSTYYGSTYYGSTYYGSTYKAPTDVVAFCAYSE